MNISSYLFLAVIILSVLILKDLKLVGRLEEVNTK
jgi:hypothetical protein